MSGASKGTLGTVAARETVSGSERRVFFAGGVRRSRSCRRCSVIRDCTKELCESASARLCWAGKLSSGSGATTILSLGQRLAAIIGLECAGQSRVKVSAQGMKK